MTNWEAETLKFIYNFRMTYERCLECADFRKSLQRYPERNLKILLHDRYIYKYRIGDKIHYWLTAKGQQWIKSYGCNIAQW